MRLKSDPVDQPERTAHYDTLLKCYTILGYSTETVLLIFPAKDRHRPLASTKLYYFVTQAHVCEHYMKVEQPGVIPATS